MTIYLDCARFQSREILHDTLAELLDFPAYYGRNLNALFDLLTERGEQTELVLRNRSLLSDHLGGYGTAFLEVLFDAARENPALSIRLEP